MKTLYITDIKPDTGTFESCLQVASVDCKNTALGKAYLALKLRDKTGECVAKLWDIPKDLPEVLVRHFLKVRAEAGTYREDLQLKILKILHLTADEVVLDDYFSASKRDRDEMLRDLDCLVAMQV